MARKGVYLERLTWAQAEAAIRGRPLAVIPIGAAMKEHGLHLQLNNDLLLARYFTRRVVQRCPVVAVPPVTYGYYPAFVEYPGSVHIRQEVFQGTIEDICRSLARHGARACYALNTGISTNWSLEPARQALAKEDIVMDYTDLRACGRAAREAVRTQRVGTHADEIETSMMLHIAPNTVRMDFAVPEEASDGPGPLTRDPRKRGVYSESGAWGDPTRATAAKGKRVVEACVEDMVKDIERLARGEIAPPRAAYLS